MGLDDLVNKAKDMLGGASAKADSAARNAAAGNDATAATDAKESGSLIDKAKEVLTDDRIDSAAGAIKDKTPDNIDAMVDKAATKAKEMND